MKTKDILQEAAKILNNEDKPIVTQLPYNPIDHLDYTHNDDGTISVIGNVNNRKNKGNT